MPEPKELSHIESKLPTRLSRLLRSKGLVLSGLATIGTVALKGFNFGASILDWVQRAELIRDPDKWPFKMLLWFLTPNGQSTLLVIAVFVLICVIAWIINAPPRDVSAPTTNAPTETPPTIAQPTKPQLPAEAQPKLTIEIDETDSNVVVGSPNRERRKIQANIKLRCQKHVEGPASLRSLHLSLIRYGADGSDVPLVARERKLTVFEWPTMNEVNTGNGWTVEQITSNYRLFVFELDITALDHVTLSHSHFLRLAINAIEQPTAWDDIRVNDWGDAQASNSSITLRRNYKGNEEIERLNDEIQTLRNEKNDLTQKNTELTKERDHLQKLKESNDQSFEIKAQEVRERTAERDTSVAAHKEAAKEIERLTKEMDTLNRVIENDKLKINEEVNQRDTWMKQYYQIEEKLTDLKWLETRMHEQGDSLNEWVKIRKVNPVKLQLLRTPRMIVLAFWVLNDSIFDVTIRLADITGCLHFKNVPRRDPATIRAARSNPTEILKPKDYVEIILEQPLLQSEAETILDSRQTPDVNGIFWLGNLNIPISVEGIAQKVRSSHLRIHPEIEHLDVHDFSYDENT